MTVKYLPAFSSTCVLANFNSVSESWCYKSFQISECYKDKRNKVLTTKCQVEY